jgi:hypothetical protein
MAKQFATIKERASKMETQTNQKNFTFQVEYNFTLWGNNISVDAETESEAREKVEEIMAQQPRFKVVALSWNKSDSKTYNHIDDAEQSKLFKYEPKVYYEISKDENGNYKY